MLEKFLMLKESPWENFLEIRENFFEYFCLVDLISVFVENFGPHWTSRLSRQRPVNAANKSLEENKSDS